MRKIINYRVASLNDVKKIQLLEAEVWGKNAATIENIKNRIEVFPDGNVIAEKNNKIIGYVSGVIISEKTAEKSKTWYEYTDNGNIKKVFDKNGKLLFGISLTVSNEVRNSGIGSNLLLQIARMAIENNLKAGILGGRIPWYYKKKDLQVEEYIKLKNESQELFDPELRLYTRMGLKVIKVQKDYFKDPESLNYGVILEWKNPFYWITQTFSFLAKPLSKLFNL